MNKVQLAEAIAMKFLGKPYFWGGDDPVQGFDCSGFVIEILKSVGKLPRKGDWTASALLQYFTDYVTENPEKGCLVFWQNNEGKIIHVEFCLDDTLAIGASGGGRHNDSVEEAIKKNAYIKIRPFRSRSGIAGYVNPFMEVPNS